MRQLLLLTLLCFYITPSLAQTPALGQTLPPLLIEDKGEVVIQDDDLAFAPWRAELKPGKIHLLQYINATIGDSKLFRPAIDRLEAELPQQLLHVTTIINLDAALWGTRGFAISELKASKREFPDATLVADKDGVGKEMWKLAPSGSIFLVMDTQGEIIFASSEKPLENDLSALLEQLKATTQTLTTRPDNTNR